MTVDPKVAQEVERLNRKWGNKSGSLGIEEFKLNVIPTGSLALDYALGTGGWPLGHPVHVFGNPDIGKSSVIGFNAIRNAQADGKYCGIIAIEPGVDSAWAAKNGVDLEKVIIARPDNGEEAFDMLYDWVTGDIIDYIVFDSIGALVSKTELDQDEIKSRVGGQSSLITDGTKRILAPCWKNNKGVMYLNQVRDNMAARVPGVVKPPGGHALKHSAAIWVHLKTNGAPYKAKVGEEEITVGRTLVGVITRNKLSEGSDRRAEFDFYQKATEEHPLGIDVGKDVVNTAIRTRVIEKKGGWFSHPTLPGDKHQVQGRDAVYEYFAEHPSAITQIRKEVLTVMLEKANKAKTSPEPDDG